jgi:hypothetical protein
MKRNFAPTKAQQAPDAAAQSADVPIHVASNMPQRSNGGMIQASNTTVTTVMSEFSGVPKSPTLSVCSVAEDRHVLRSRASEMLISVQIP